MKIVINSDFGGFGLSDLAIEMYLNAHGTTFQRMVNDSGSRHWYEVNGELFTEYDIVRSDPMLVWVVEQLGDRACSQYANLKIVEVPDDVKWHICEYDGIEHIAEDHRTWR